MTIIIGFFCWGMSAFAAEEEPDRQIFGGPKEGEPAPAFALKDLQGREVRLEQFKKKQPVVLVTGSYSCPVFRRQARALERLRERYGARAAFFLLYTVEAHPVGSASPYAAGEWVTEENRRERVLVRQPESYEERVGRALECRTALNSGIRVLIDGMDNSVWESYGRAPNAAYVIDSKGKIVVRQEWLDPGRLERDLLEMLQEEPAKW